MQPFLIPAVLHKIGGQPIEQIGVGGRFAIEAKVARGVHDAASEMVLPNTVDEHSCGQRMLPIGQVSGVGDATAGGGTGGFVQRQRWDASCLGEDAEFARLNFIARAARVATEEYCACLLYTSPSPRD